MAPGWKVTCFPGGLSARPSSGWPACILKIEIEDVLQAKRKRGLSEFGEEEGSDEGTTIRLPESDAGCIFV